MSHLSNSWRGWPTTNWFFKVQNRLHATATIKWIRTVIARLLSCNHPPNNEDLFMASFFPSTVTLPYTATRAKDGAVTVHGKSIFFQNKPCPREKVNYTYPASKATTSAGLFNFTWLTVHREKFNPPMYDKLYLVLDLEEPDTDAFVEALADGNTIEFSFDLVVGGLVSQPITLILKPV